MPDIGYFHPQLVHFSIVLAIVGVAFRVISLTGRLKWTHPAAATLLIACGVITFFTERSGHDAHGPAERVPGALEAVQTHEHWGERTRNMFLVIAALELVGLAMGTRKGAVAVRGVAALAGLAGVYMMYETAEHGGELVYEYAGGIGTRSGDSADVRRLLVAGLYHQAQAERAAGRSEGAARLIEEMARQMPGDFGVRYLLIESQLKDRHDAAGALEAARTLAPAADDARGRMRKGLLLSDVYQALGFSDSARAVLQGLLTEFPESRGLQRALDAIK
ncbi:MAG: DUF2231 domain-containing protein [Gemmatimonadales bacterium]